MKEIVGHAVGASLESVEKQYGCGRNSGGKERVGRVRNHPAKASPVIIHWGTGVTRAVSDVVEHVIGVPVAAGAGADDELSVGAESRELVDVMDAVVG